MERGRGFQTLTSAALNDLYHENTDFDATGQQARTFENLLRYLEVVVAAKPDNVGRKVIRKSRIFSLFLFMRLLDNSSVALARNLAEVARHFWSDAAEVEEPVGRVGSAAALEEHLVWFTSKHMLDMRLPDLDRNRLFSNEQKTQIWSRFGGLCGLCGICGKPASEQYVEYDHIKPWYWAEERKSTMVARYTPLATLVASLHWHKTPRAESSKLPRPLLTSQRKTPVHSVRQTSAARDSRPRVPG